MEITRGAALPAHDVVSRNVTFRTCIRIRRTRKIKEIVRLLEEKRAIDSADGIAKKVRWEPDPPDFEREEIDQELLDYLRYECGGEWVSVMPKKSTMSTDSSYHGMSTLRGVTSRSVSLSLNIEVCVSQPAFVCEFLTLRDLDVVSDRSGRGQK